MNETAERTPDYGDSIFPRPSDVTLPADSCPSQDNSRADAHHVLPFWIAVGQIPMGIQSNPLPRNHLRSNALRLSSLLGRPFRPVRCSLFPRGWAAELSPIIAFEGLASRPSSALVSTPPRTHCLQGSFHSASRSTRRGCEATTTAQRFSSTKRKLSCVLRSVRRGAKLEASGRGARRIASVERNRGADPRLWGFNLSASLRCDVTGRLVPQPRQFSC